MQRLILPIALAALSGCAATQPTVPAQLQPAGEKLARIVPATGVQIYECRARKDGAGHEWAFVGPEADLLDNVGRRIGRHYGGPTWEALDGSKVVGKVRERADAPQAGAIPWLLLEAKSTGAEGAYSKVTSIQRLNTVGGVAPQGGCALASLGQQARVHYTADYHFYVR